jgi:hypothetical protein
MKRRLFRNTAWMSALEAKANVADTGFLCYVFMIGNKNFVSLSDE